ncbi:MAG: DUF3854 domain-containing protein [Clostridiales bacterium]|nr:DUF3854 domain-containing protein [Clostridiales bacterium]
MAVKYEYKWSDVCSWTGTPYKEHGTYQVPCPFCRAIDKHKKMYVDADKRVFNCFHCGKSGGAVELYAQVYNLSFEEAKDEMKNRVKGEFGSVSRIAPATPKQELKVVDIKQAKPLHMDYRDKVYRAMLDALTLTDADRRYLRSKGLSDAAINGLRFRSLPVGTIARNRLVFALQQKGYQNLIGIPGFYEKDGKVKFVPFENGILIPVISPDKKIQSFQIRSTAEVAKDKRYYSLSSARFYMGLKSETYVHCAIPNKDIQAAYLTEGCLKADIAAFKSGKPFLAILGVNCTKHLEGALKQFQNLKKIYIAFDMDKFENENVMHAQEQLVKLLQKMGITPEIVNWDRRYKGIDDFLTQS